MGVETMGGGGLFLIFTVRSGNGARIFTFMDLKAGSKKAFVTAAAAMLSVGMIHGLQLINIGCHTDTKLTFGRLTAIVGQNGTGKTTVLKAAEQAEKMAQTNNAVNIKGLWERESKDILEDVSLIIPIFQAAPTLRERKYNVEKTNFCFLIHVDSQEDKESASYLTEFNSSGWGVKFSRDESIWFPPSDFQEKKSWKHLGEYDSLYQMSDFDGKWQVEEWPGDEGPYTLANSSDRVMRDVRDRLRIGTCRYLKVALHSLREPSYTAEIQPQLSTDASNLASVLADLMASNRPKFIEILRALQGVVPSILDIRAKRCPVTLQEATSVTVNRREIPYFEDRTVPGFQLRFDTTTGKNLPATSISDGTLYALALATLIATSERSTLILIDDVESGLHPSAQRALVRQIKALQEQNTGLQIIITTHSPYVIDELEANQVWLLHQNSDEGVAAKKLSEHPRAKEALEVLTTGEFWTSEGEAWVSDEKATAAAF